MLIGPGVCREVDVTESDLGVEFVDDLITDVHPADRAVGRAAARLRADHAGLPLAGALTVATAQLTGAAEILTTARRLDGVDDRVRMLGQVRLLSSRSQVV